MKQRYTYPKPGWGTGDCSLNVHQVKGIWCGCWNERQWSSWFRNTSFSVSHPFLWQLTIVSEPYLARANIHMACCRWCCLVIYALTNYSVGFFSSITSTLLKLSWALLDCLFQSLFFQCYICSMWLFLWLFDVLTMVELFFNFPGNNYMKSSKRIGK